MFRSLSIVWLQLSHGRVKLLVAVTGVVFAVLLMWMQLGVLDSVPRSGTVVQQHLNADLVLINPQSQATFRLSAFSQKLLHRTSAHGDVALVQAAYTEITNWRNPWTAQERLILVYGFEPYGVPLSVPGLAEHWHELRLPDTCVFDELSRTDYGPVGEAFRQGRKIQPEINHRRSTVVGVTQMGPSFAADGTVITSDSNFLRIFPRRVRGAIDLGLIRLRPGANAPAVRADLQALLGKDVRVLTIPEFVAFEEYFWLHNSPIGLIFSMGAAMGCLVGFVIVYQILHSDVTNHLPQYATLKAIGFTDGYLWRLVLLEALTLAFLGYFPGTLLASALFRVAAQATHLPLEITWPRALQILALTLCMCVFSGTVAVRKLRSADPADVF